MIVAVFGVPGLSFAELTYLLTELGIGFMAVTDKPHRIGQPSQNHIVPVVFGSVRSFLQHYQKIKFRSVAFVCDTYTKLAIEHGFGVLGVNKLSSKRHEYTQFHVQELGAILQSVDGLRMPITAENLIEPKAYDPAAEMISKFSQSALTQTQSLMYKVKNQELRSKTFLLVKSWFLGDIKSSDTLRSRLKNIHSSDKYVDDLMVVMTASEGQALRRVTIESRKNPNRIEVLTKRANISPFDVRYLLSKGNR
jgi:hypothetical protein